MNVKQTPRTQLLFKITYTNNYNYMLFYVNFNNKETDISLSFVDVLISQQHDYFLITNVYYFFSDNNISLWFFISQSFFISMSLFYYFLNLFQNKLLRKYYVQLFN